MPRSRWACTSSGAAAGAVALPLCLCPCLARLPPVAAQLAARCGACLHSAGVAPNLLALPLCCDPSAPLSAGARMWC